MAMFNAARALLFSFLFMMAITALASETSGKITGIITTADGQPAAYVSVSLKGTTLAALTNEKGLFSLPKVKPGTYTMVISAVGSRATERQLVVNDGETTRISERLEVSAKELQHVVVTAGNRYAPKTSSIATRLSVPVKDIPQSIQIISAQIIKDRGIQTVGEATKSMVGVNAFSSQQYSDYVMRGFRTNAGNFAYNGLRGDLYQFDQGTTTYNIERIEAIKGPASVLFSAGNPGGVINHVTKKALSAPRYEAEVTAGSFNQYRMMGDATGPLGKSKKLLYRLVAGYENSGQLDQKQKIENVFLAPQLHYNFSDRTSLNYELNYSRDHRTMGYQRGVPALATGDNTWQLDRYPVDFSMIDPNSYSKTTNVSNQLNFSHELGKKLKLTTLFRSVHASQDQFYWTPEGFGTGAVNDSLDFSYGFFNQKPYQYQSSIFLNWEANSGSINHNLVAGFDFNKSGRYYEYAGLLSERQSLLNLRFSRQTFSYSGIDLSSAQFQGGAREATQLYGAYFQDMITIGTRWKALVGLRYENHRYDVDYSDLAAKVITSSDTLEANKLLPRMGLVYQPGSATSLYASYTQGFQPQFSSNRGGGGPFPPEGSRQYEAGLKQELFNGKLLATAAAFSIEKYDVVTPDPSDATGVRQLLTDQVSSRGIEVSLQGAVTTELSVLANYAYTDARAEVFSGYDFYEPGRFPNAPYNSGNLWVDYKLNEGALKGLHVGIGGVHVGDRTTFIKGFNLPAYTIFDGVIGYRYQQVNVNLNAYNLTDKRYYYGAYGPANLWPGNPLSFRLTLNYTFNR
jgi:iron complex outermembrane receptor protein